MRGWILRDRGAGPWQHLRTSSLFSSIPLPHTLPALLPGLSWPWRSSNSSVRPFISPEQHKTKAAWKSALLSAEGSECRGRDMENSGTRRKGRGRCLSLPLWQQQADDGAVVNHGTWLLFLYGLIEATLVRCRCRAGRWKWARTEQVFTPRVLSSLERMKRRAYGAWSLCTCLWSWRRASISHHSTPWLRVHPPRRPSQQSGGNSHEEKEQGSKGSCRTWFMLKRTLGFFCFNVCNNTSRWWREPPKSSARSQNNLQDTLL